jgi:hypothetical protein
MATSMTWARLACFAALVLACACAVPVAGLAAAPTTAHRAHSCWSGYSYDGVQSPGRAYGVSATLALAARSVVSNGHVAAWIGVGGAGLGPGGSDEWVQAGIAHDAGGLDVLYYEYKQPGDAVATYVRLAVVSPGESHDVVVYERAAQRDSWRVMVDGNKVSDPISLPGSHGRFQPVATAENWDGGVAGSCNAYAFDFSNLAVRAQYAGAWQAFDLSRVLRDPAYAIKLRPSGFTASSR